MVITAKDSMILNGVSSDTIGLYIDTPPVPPMANQRYIDYQTGADTDNTYPDDTFENIQISITAYQFYPENFDNRQIYDFLKNPKTLQLSRFDDYYFKVQKMTAENPESEYHGNRIRYRINFECQPFKYALKNDVIDISNGDTVVNGGNRYSRPIWTISGNGNNVSFIVNGAVFHLAGIAGTIAIDCEKMLAYSSTNIINSITDGHFPFLQVGSNSVSWRVGLGSITRVTVQKNERWY